MQRSLGNIMPTNCDNGDGDGAQPFCDEGVKPERSLLLEAFSLGIQCVFYLVSEALILSLQAFQLLIQFCSSNSTQKRGSRGQAAQNTIIRLGNRIGRSADKLPWAHGAGWH